MTAVRRIQKELSELNNKPIPGVSIDYEEDNILSWKVSMKGPPDSPYKGGKFTLDVKFDTTFPFKAPEVKFLTKVYHPGINEEGAICLPMLKDEWKPAITMSKVLTTILDKLGHPSPDDPFNPDIAAELKENESKFKATAKEWTKK
ncbi:UBC-like protein [Cantharellus anzutake]|uniref:UBC-like protein n=1 Tax=Cantharellus anzutake TaxID=1750568 RepID=UPI001908BB5A|nr:UBC-like protein [Cantharellus anzutake]KAF8334279.1 UBC-like protein [Cantharellus anzutake]